MMRVLSDDDYDRKVDELDPVLNDPDVPLEPVRLWSLLAEIAHHDLERPLAR